MLMEVELTKDEYLDIRPCFAQRDKTFCYGAKLQLSHTGKAWNLEGPDLPTAESWPQHPCFLRVLAKGSCRVRRHNLLPRLAKLHGCVPAAKFGPVL